MKLKMIMSVIALTMMLSIGIDANAAQSSLVDFTSAGKLQYSNEDLIGNTFSNMIPGVEKELEITLKNSYSTNVNYYMSAKNIEALSGANVEQQTGAYDIVMSVGNTTVYDSTVGGYIQEDGSYTGSEGLEELDALEGWVYLTTLSPGQSTNFRFAITLDGLTNGSEYENALGSIDFDFGAGYQDVPGTTTVNNIITTKTAAKKNIVTTIQDVFVPLANGVNAVKTGDPAAIGLLIGIGCVGIVGLGLTRRKKSTEEIR